MSATNKTTNYELPIFVGTDKPAWLVDWNGAMTAIDTALHQVEGKADQAGTDIGGIESSISTINSTITSINNAVSQLRIDTNANTGSINTITSLIGNGEPTTTDKTLIGAINELHAEFDFVNSATGTIGSVITGGTVGAGSIVKCLLNADKTIGKVYGGVRVSGESIQINEGVNVICTITGLGLETISESYDILLGFAVCRNTSNALAWEPAYIRFNTNGSVSLILNRAGSGTNALNMITIDLPPCVYFLSNLGD